MKQRQGFVSNSSSSSFIVETKDMNEESLLTEDQLEALSKANFRPTNISHPEYLEYAGFEENPVSADQCDHVGCSVSCNEDEVAAVLVSNNIPFRAVTHYGHHVWIFDPERDPDIIQLTNYGSIALMYGLDSSLFRFRPPPDGIIQKIKKEELL